MNALAKCFRNISVVISLWAVAPGALPAAEYEWTFSERLSIALGNGAMSYADGSVTEGLTRFGVTDGSTIPHIGGRPATYMHVPAFTGAGNGYHLKLHDSPANGGGSLINQYTVMYDLYLPGSPNWTALFNADPRNTSGNDADWYIAPDGGIGIGTGGYSPAGTIMPNTWYRIGLSVNLTANTASTYVNGTLVKQNSGTLYARDGRLALFPNNHTLHSLLLFNEASTSGVYTHELYVNTVYFTDRTLTPAQMAAFGGPNAVGIAVPEPGKWPLLGIGTLAFMLWRQHWKR